jgi:hypothetical protein
MDVSVFNLLNQIRLFPYAHGYYAVTRFFFNLRTNRGAGQLGQGEPHIRQTHSALELERSQAPRVLSFKAMAIKSENPER